MPLAAPVIRKFLLIAKWLDIYVRSICAEDAGRIRSEIKLDNKVTASDSIVM